MNPSSKVSNESGRIGPLVILLIGLPCVDLLLYALWSDNVIKNAAFFFGLLIGQAAFVSVLAGAMGRAWVLSILLSNLLMIGVPLSMIAWETWWFNDEMHDQMILTFALSLPLLLSGSLPFLLIRGTLGYWLRRFPSSKEEFRSIRMEELFIATAITAASLVTVPAAFKVVGLENEVPLFAVQAVIILAVSLLIVLPTTVLYMRVTSFALRIGVLVGIGIGVPFLAVYLLSQSGLLQLSGTTFVEEFAPILVTAAGCFALCLVVIRAAGFQWVASRRQSELATEPSEFDTESDGEEVEKLALLAGRVRWTNRIAAAVLVLSSLAQVAIYGSIGAWRTNALARLVKMEEEWKRAGGKLNRYNYTAQGILAPPTARLDDIEYVMQSNGLWSIELAGTQITDEMLAKVGRLGLLNTINFNNTAVTDRGLMIFKNADNLGSVRVGYTKVTVAGLQEFVAARSPHSLDARGLRLTDDDIAEFWFPHCELLLLADNPLTDASIPHLLGARTLDLSRTNIVGANLALLHSVQHLILDGTAIDDQRLEAFLKSGSKVEGLSLRGTKVTDKCLPLMNSLTNLYLGNCGITTEGLIQSTLNPTYHLALNDKRYDGVVFAGRKWSIIHLDLRGSSISDRDIHTLANVSGLGALNLRGCDLTDASLPLLATLPAKVLDLSETKITGDAAVEALNTHVLYLTMSQCSQAIVEQWEESDHPQKGPIMIDQRLEPSID